MTNKEPHSHDYQLAYQSKISGQLEKIVEACGCGLYRHMFTSGFGHTDWREGAWCEDEGDSQLRRRR